MQVVFLVVLSGAVLVDKLSASMFVQWDNELRVPVPVELALSPDLDIVYTVAPVNAKALGTAERCAHSRVSCRVFVG